MKYFILCLFSWFSLSLTGQITPSERSHDFGDIYGPDQSYVDIVFTNNTENTQFLLTIEKPRDVNCLSSGKKLLPDSSIIIRFKINEAIKGKFNYPVEIYFSDSSNPVVINLYGNVREVVQNSMTNCPDFNSKPSTVDNDFTLVVKVIDSITREPIPNATVYLVERGELVGEYKTNTKGIVVKNAPIGFYFITAEKNPYASNYFEGYVNRTRNYVEIELSTTPPPIEYYEEPEIVINEEEPEVVIIENDPEKIDSVPISITEIVTEEEPIVPIDIPPLAAIPDSTFDPSYFKYSNITFILDASSSMNAYGKLDLLKMSMIELVKILRTEDNITILKYAAEVDIILEHTSGDKKEEIINTIKGIKTSGSTAGGDAIKTAYALNNEKYKHDGNNLVIIITDGLFNAGAKDYDAVIAQHYKNHGTIFSVVGIKTTSYIAEHLKLVAQKGGGDFIPVNNIQDAQENLVNELKRTAYKG